MFSLYGVEPPGRWDKPCASADIGDLQSRIRGWNTRMQVVPNLILPKEVLQVQPACQR